jgi:dihydroorotase
MTASFVRDTARDFCRALVMPNLKEPVWLASNVEAYREEILSVAPFGFEPLMTIYLTEKTTPEIILEAGKVGAIAAKFYPRHGTTRSDHGLSPGVLFNHEDWLEALQQANMVLCIHAENPFVPMLEREESFLRLLLETEVSLRFPKLRIVIEHATTELATKIAMSIPNVAATITAHHLVLTTDDVIGNHDCLCMPVAKSEYDRRALVKAAISGHPRIFFGSDSAPHPRSAKNRARGACGLYTSPVALPILAQVFSKTGLDMMAGARLKMLPDFASKFGAEWYHVSESKEVIEIVQESQFVFDRCLIEDDPSVVQTFWAGRRLDWSVRYDY